MPSSFRSWLRWWHLLMTSEILISSLFSLKALPSMSKTLIHWKATSKAQGEEKLHPRNAKPSPSVVKCGPPAMPIPSLNSQEKRKRKPRYPKGFDPENPGPMPDPERWLPKWQRSGYKKRHQRKKDAVKGSQGAGKVDESLDRALHKSEPSTSRPAKPPGRGRKGRRK